MQYYLRHILLKEAWAIQQGCWSGTPSLETRAQEGGQLFAAVRDLEVAKKGIWNGGLGLEQGGAGSFGSLSRYSNVLAALYCVIPACLSRSVLSE
jgi:hypothetical protein